MALHSLAAFLLLTAIGTARIVTTYNVFGPTSDEPAHIACGMEWLSKGVYRYEPQHPPLARVAAAIGPYLAGVRSYGYPRMNEEGTALIFRGGDYERNIFLARLGILPFFWIAAAVIYFWGRRYLGEPTTFFAVLLFTFLPPILAHAGLATTDMPLTAMLTAAFFMFIVWVDDPSWKNSTAFGAIFALAVLSKFSSLAYFPSACVLAAVWYLTTRRPSSRELSRAAMARLGPLCVVIAVCLLMVWSGYRFSLGTSHFLSMKIAAPELFDGIEQVKYHNSNGHLAYLLGRHSQFGWWYYYFVVLALKTPLPFLALLGIGMFTAVKENRGLVLGELFSGGVLIVAIFSHINIGVRHILPIYVGMSLVAAAGAVKLFEQSSSSSWARWAGLTLIGWMIATSIASHPDYIPYFNALAGDQPENILADSDLDWGQDNKRLGERLAELGAKEVNFSQIFYADLKALGYPPVREIDAIKPAPGWNAVNLTLLKALRFGWGDDHPDWQSWMNQIKPTERVGKGIWLWYIPPGSIPAR